MRRSVWPWLKSRGYAADEDDRVLEEWLASCLGRRDAFLRPGLRLDAPVYAPDDSPARLRGEINAILAAAKEPALPG